MPSLHFDHPWHWFVLWNALAFAVSFIPNSFIEWLSHRFVLHSQAIVKFAYHEHDRTHHVIYGADETFGNRDFDYGVDFTLRDWVLFIVVTTPIWVGIEIAIGRPILIGASVSTLLWLQMFNVLHKHYHAPNGSWIETTGYFNFLKEHHRVHHRETRSNLNVAFFPIADFCLGTLKRGRRAGADLHDSLSPDHTSRAVDGLENATVADPRMEISDSVHGGESPHEL